MIRAGMDQIKYPWGDKKTLPYQNYIALFPFSLETLILFVQSIKDKSSNLKVATNHGMATAAEVINHSSSAR